MKDNKLAQIIQFVVEIDKLKRIYRQSFLMDGSRNENTAEHSWHLAMMGAVLSEYANTKVDVCRVVKMLLIHDIVEIDAGDTYIYDLNRNGKIKRDKERNAAQRIFGILPKKQSREFQKLFYEFDSRKTNDAKFAAAIDRLQPMIHNYMTKGKSWKKHKVSSAEVIERNKHMGEGSKKLWQYAQTLISDSIRQGILAESPK